MRTQIIDNTPDDVCLPDDLFDIVDQQPKSKSNDHVTAALSNILILVLAENPEFQPYNYEKTLDYSGNGQRSPKLPGASASVALIGTDGRVYRVTVEHISN